ncbi:MAG: hypothetical protein ACK5IP_06160, partial [Paracoccus sp. (in: a-proteobacteria)]
AVPATGMTEAYSSTVIPPCLTGSVADSRWREAMGLPARTIVTNNLGQSGQSAAVLGAARFEAGYRHWTKEALRLNPRAELRWFNILQGTANDNDAEGVYEAAATAIWSDICHWVWEETGQRPAPVFMQDGGRVNNGGSNWGVTLDQLKVVENIGGLLGGPLYPYPVTDNNVHQGAYYTMIWSEMRSIAKVHAEMGFDWNLLPLAPTFTGNQVIVPFSLMPQERIVPWSDHPYADFGGVTDTGIILEGATFVSAEPSVDGRSLVITGSGPITAVNHAFNRTGDYLASADGSNTNYMANRSTWVTSRTFRSLMDPDYLHHRHLPSFSFAV